ncbi:MAG: hypothetical protein OXL98_06315 [Acidimicrobiaceae bacterium]|nr:hypothetical protein [Acidimicrobiaceae bacterium]
MTDQPQANADQQPLYRSEAYQQRGRVAPIDGIVRVTAPREWLVLVLLGVVVVAVVVWSLLGRLESGVSAACVLRTAGERHGAAASAPGVVAETPVAPGERVGAGDPLVRLAAPELSLAAELAQARSAALATQHPGSVEAVAAAAEAEALRAAEAAATVVVAPVSGVMGPLVLPRGAAVAAGDTVAEVLDASAAPPTAILAVDPGEAARLRASMEVSVSVTAAGAPDAVRAGARLAATGAAAPLAGDGALAGADAGPGGSGPGASGILVAAEFDDPPAAFEDLALQPRAAYSCDARIVTGSRRPIGLLIGRG